MMASTSNSDSQVSTTNNRIATGNSNKKMIQEQHEDDETDSCFEFIKRRNLAVGGASMVHAKAIVRPEELAVEQKAEPFESEKRQDLAPKVVAVKPITQFSAKTSPIKTVSVKTSSFKQGIDRIAENLKALQEQKKLNAPKVTQVTATKSAVVNCKDLELDEKLKKIKLSPKEIAHQLILLRCNKQNIEFNNKTSSSSDDNQKNTKMDEYEMNEDLTNLNWLTTFNLTKSSGISQKYPLSLSPPATPSSPISPVSTNHNNSSIDDTDAMVDNVDEDEADSNHLAAHSINKNSTVWPFISKLFKSYQYSPNETKKENIASTVKVSQAAQRPAYSYSCLTFLAIESSQRKRLSVKEIYSWVISHLPYYRSVPSGSWKNSIRYNLSMNQMFCKVDKNLLAMRDFSGKGSLWCINPDIRVKLIEALEKTCSTGNFQQFLNLPYLQDVNETVRPVCVNSANPAVTVQKIPKNRTTSNLSSVPMTIINPRLTQKLNFNAASTSPKSLKHRPFGEGFNQKPTVVISPAALRNQKRLESNNNTHKNSDLTELDAVKALLSMKSRTSSTPSQDSDEVRSKAVDVVNKQQGRRKQVFKPPMKKPHINPRLLEKCSNALYYDDAGEDEDDEIEEELDDEEEEMYFSQEELENTKMPKKLQIKFPNFTPKKSNENDHIVTMSDDESYDLDENKLEIDEEYIEPKNQLEESSDEQQKVVGAVDLIKEESNESSNLEPGEVRKSKPTDNNKANSTDEPNMLLELSRAASLVEDKKPAKKQEKETEGLAEEDNQVANKAKKLKLTTTTVPVVSQVATTTTTTTTTTRSTRSSANKLTSQNTTSETTPLRTTTRSVANKRKSK